MVREAATKRGVREIETGLAVAVRDRLPRHPPGWHPADQILPADSRLGYTGSGSGPIDAGELKSWQIVEPMWYLSSA